MTYAQFNILKLTHKAIYSDCWPSYLHLDIRNPKHSLRSSIAPQLTIPLSKETFQDSAASLFNSLEPTVRNERDHVLFISKCLASLWDICFTRFQATPILTAWRVFQNGRSSKEGSEKTTAID